MFWMKKVPNNTVLCIGCESSYQYCVMFWMKKFQIPRVAVSPPAQDNYDVAGVSIPPMTPISLMSFFTHPSLDRKAPSALFRCTGIHHGGYPFLHAAVWGGGGWVYCILDDRFFTFLRLSNMSILSKGRCSLRTKRKVAQNKPSLVYVLCVVRMQKFS
jgi:hypothetical protein